MNPFQTAPNGRKILTLIGVYIALITSLFVSVSDSILLPVAAKEIGGLDYYPLSTSLSGCLSISLMPLYGFIAAKSPSAKRLLMVFSFLIAGAIVLCRGLAASMWAIIIPSFFAACYAPAIYVLGYSTIRDMYDARQASVFLGLAGTMMAIGTICGAPLFGALTGLAGWRFPFFVIGP
ncbi:MAG: MFS transporter, partial [Treponema sp.]|nr:MFS transporter [Treponema sp.]